MKLSLFSLLLLAFPSHLLCEGKPITIKGKVVEVATNQGIAFATILVQNTNYCTSANKEGEFSVSIPSSGAYLIVSCINYKTKKIKVFPEDSLLIIKLVPVEYILDKVDVTAENSSDDTLSFSLGSKQIKNLAPILNDPLGSLQMMPGVSNDDEMSALINVRGGTSDENTVLIDGVKIYRPYHLNEISMSGVGVFNINLVKKIDFSTGGWNAKYGDALSSVINIGYKEGSRDHFICNADLGVTDLSVSLQGPLSSNSSFIFAGRESYFSYILRKIHENQGVNAGYYDFQGDLCYDINSLSRLKVTFLYSKDNASQDPTNVSDVQIYPGIVDGKNTTITQSTNTLVSYDGNYSSSMLSASFESLLFNQLISQTVVSYSGEAENQWPINLLTKDYHYTGLNDLWSSQLININLDDNLGLGDLSLNQEMKYKMTSFLDLDMGIGIHRISYNYAPNLYGSVVYKTNTINFPDTTISDSPYNVNSPDTTAIKASTYATFAYLQQMFHLSKDLNLNFGMRFDYFGMDKESRYSPRINLSYLLPFRINLNLAWGIYYERPDYNQLRSSKESSNNTSFQKVTSYLFGLEKDFSDLGRLDMDFYWKDYSSLIPVTRLTYGSLYYGTRQNDGVGFAYGMDLQWSLNLKDVRFLVSYGYLVAREKTLGVNEQYYPRITDQRNTFVVAAIFNPGDNWALTAKGFYGSGYAYTPYVTLYDAATRMNLWVQGGENSSHYPAYERIDFSITKSFHVFGNVMKAYLSVANILNRKNILSYNYTYDANGNPERVPLLPLGILPTLGVNYTFGF